MSDINTEAIQEEALEAVRHKLSAICIGDAVPPRTYTCMYKYKLVNTAKELENIDIIKTDFLYSKSHCDIPGPYIFSTRNNSDKIVIKVAHYLLRTNPTIREEALKYLLSECKDCLCPRSIQVIHEYENDIISNIIDIWTAAAVKAHDIIQNDWLFNHHGLLQSIHTGFIQGMKECMTAVMRPKIASLEALNKGVLSASNNRNEIIDNIHNIISISPTFPEALDNYYNNYGHIPLGKNMSVSFLYSEWTKNKGPIENIWEIAWDWAESYISPIPKYHICSMFLNNPDLITDMAKMLNVISNIIRASDKDIPSESWLVRCELARYYTHYLECRLPGANSDKIVSQSWWLADKLASVYGDNEEDIKGFRDTTVKSEESMMYTIWKTSYLATSPSSLRYGTLYLNNIWSLSICSQLNKSSLSALLSQATPEQTEQIISSVSGFILNLFPMNLAGEIVYAFDTGCISTGKHLIECLQTSEKEILSALMPGIEQIGDNKGFREALKKLPGANIGDQFLICLAFKIKCYLDNSVNNYIWECLLDDEWRKDVIDNLELKLIEILFDGIHEIQLKVKGKWDEQLPHIYASLCKEFESNKDKCRLLFALTLISSIAAGSVSAIERLVRTKDKFIHREDIVFWRNNILHSLPYLPEWNQARLRAFLSCLHI